MSAARQFVDAQAKREATPMLFGLIGPSGSGKTFSALRLATGMQRVVGGEIFVIDTEHRRALHYADRFSFRHVDFRPPFSPDDYLAAIRYCTEQGAKIIVIDSMSHEHEGQGGVLEWHDAEVERISKAWRVGADKANIPAWNKPKAARRALIQEIIQSGASIIMCFRAKNKLKIGNKEVTTLGFMPIAGEEFVFELSAKALLLPGADGVPTWNPENPGEKLMTKIPIQFRELFSGKAGKQLDEDTGEALARWAAGDEVEKQSPKPTAAKPAQTPPEPAGDEDDAKPSASVMSCIRGYEQCQDTAVFDELEMQREALWSLSTTRKGDKLRLKNASDDARKRLQVPA